MQAPDDRCRKQQVEDFPISLDIDRLIELRILCPGFPSTRTIYWTDSDKKIFSLVIDAQVVHPTLSWVELRFFVADPAGKRREVEQTMPIARTYPGFGRVRYWFVDEGRRVGTLYLPEGSQEFRSRHVHRLAYASQGLTKKDRVARRHARIMRRLGADPNTEKVPPKPPRMRFRTYYRLLSQLKAGDSPVGERCATTLPEFSLDPPVHLPTTPKAARSRTRPQAGSHPKLNQTL